jgi:glycosyltransferase involved in cell wall biosynthesis
MLTRRKLKNVLLMASFAQCPRVWKIASVLAERNFKVSILEWDRTSRLSAAENVNNIHVYRMKLRAPYGSRLIFALPIWWIYLFLFLLSHNFEIIQPQNLDNLFPSWVATRLRGVRIVYDIADFYADAYLPSRMASLRKAVAWLERMLIKAADANIIVDESRSKQVNLPYLSFCVIYNTPPDRYENLKIKRADKSFSNSKFALFYAGILERDRGLGTLVEAVQGLDDVRLTVAGFGRMEKEFSDLIREKNNIELLGRIAYDAVLEFTLLCDCVVALYDPSIPNNVFASPNKLFEAMMSGKPVIVSAGTAMANKVMKESCGLVVNYGNVNELKKAIETLKDNQSLAVSLGRNGRNAYLKEYNWCLMQERLLRLYEAIVPASRR